MSSRRPPSITTAWPRLLVIALGALPARPAGAHSRTTTVSDLHVQPEAGAVVVDWSVRVRPADLLEPLGLPADADPALVRARERAARAVVRGHLRVTLDGQPCPEERAADVATPVGRDLRFAYRFACAAAGGSGELRASYTLFFDLDPLHTGFARVRLAGQPVATHVFRSDDEDLSLSVALPGTGAQALQYLALGVEHILLGYDHLAFLLALVLGVLFARAPAPGQPRAPGSPRAVLLATLSLVTAFTVAHSLTLAWAALRAGPEGDVPSWVEPAIALSVAWVGCENLLPRPPRRRWLLAFGFGLVHGFGFASALQEVGLPRGATVIALLAFNLGVELGQLALVALALPLLSWAARRAPRGFLRWGVQAPSLLIGALGLLWFALRLAAPG